MRLEEFPGRSLEADPKQVLRHAYASTPPSGLVIFDFHELEEAPGEIQELERKGK